VILSNFSPEETQQIIGEYVAWRIAAGLSHRSHRDEEIGWREREKK
jgi:hypothetical protein